MKITVTLDIEKEDAISIMTGYMLCEKYGIKVTENVPTIAMTLIAGLVEAESKEGKQKVEE